MNVLITLRVAYMSLRKIHKEKMMKEKILENITVLRGTELEPVQGYMVVKDGVIQEIGRGNSSKSGRDMNQSFIIPPFVNAHTHIGDSVRKGLYQGKKQQEMVGEGGLKFGALEECSEEEKIGAMGDTLMDMKESGTLAHCDFREYGIKGSRLLRRAENKAVKSIILTRPTSENELEEILSEVEGIGIPSLDFLSTDSIGLIAEKVTRADKILSVHASETKSAHEKSLEEHGITEIQRALKFDPTFLVHGTWATRDDLKSMSDADVPLVICPRSNSLLSTGLPPIKQALEEGVELWLGTDNVSVAPPIMFRELSFAWTVLRLQSEGAGRDEARELLKAATVNPAEGLDLPFGPIVEGQKAAFTVISRKRNLLRCENPHVGIVNRAGVNNVEEVFLPKAD